MSQPGASESMRALGLLVDGPARWGSPVPSRAAGIFVVELPGGAAAAPLDAAAVRRWLERVPELTLDGRRPTVQQLTRRLAELWLAHEPVLYVGRTARALGPRVAALYATPLGDARPHSGGHWLKTLSVLPELRVWWAETDAHEEYEDALLGEVGARNAPAASGARRLPFANQSAPADTALHGLANSLRSTPAAGASSSRSSSSAVAARKPPRAPARPRKPAAARAVAARPPAAATALSREGMDLLGAELEELRTTVRPQVIARVKAARELGDLRENADYEYARKEQSFVEGRIQTLEHMLRTGVVIGQPPSADVVHLGSTVEVESDGERATYSIVGSAEARPGAGRLSNESPVGRALLGARAGDEVVVQIPGGSIRYRVIEVR